MIKARRNIRKKTKETEYKSKTVETIRDIRRMGVRFIKV